jgi:hypothetical protein
MLIPIVAAVLVAVLFACAEPQRRSVPEETLEAAGRSTDAGEAPNTRGGSALRTPDAGADLLGPGDGGAGGDR